jgi:hypothetical protein
MSSSNAEVNPSVLETVSGRIHKVSVSYLAEPPTNHTIVDTILKKVPYRLLAHTSESCRGILEVPC